MARLVKDGKGGYATADGRWKVEPVTMGGGVTGFAGGRGWSNGRREWLVTDTTGAARLGLGGARVTVDALWRARDLIDANSKEA